MIWLRADAPPGLLSVRADGIVRASDYREILLPALEARPGPLRVVYELGDEFRRFTLGALWQDCRLGARLFGRIERLAVVSDRHWIRASTLAFSCVRPGRVCGFPVARFDEAVAWAATTSADGPARS
jgi:hypothetical protein